MESQGQGTKTTKDFSLVAVQNNITLYSVRNEQYNNTNNKNI